MTQGKSIEHAYWNLFNTLHKSLCWWWQLLDASCMEKPVVCCAQVWFCPIVPHSLHIPKVPWAPSELWPLVLSIDFQLNSGQVIGWVILAALFSSSETNWEFPWLCSWDHCLHFIFIRWQQIFIKNVSVYFSILPLIIWNVPVPYDKKQSHITAIFTDFLPVFHRLI